jgi:hypothetical protein
VVPVGQVVQVDKEDIEVHHPVIKAREVSNATLVDRNFNISTLSPKSTAHKVLSSHNRTKEWHITRQDPMDNRGCTFGGQAEVVDQHPTGM